MGIETDQILAARSYATAVRSVATKDGKVQEVHDDAQVLKQTLTDHPDFQVFLESPSINPSRKHELIDKVFKGKLSEVLMNLLGLMIDRERAVILPHALDELIEIMNRDLGIEPGVITTARELSEDGRNQLQSALEKYTGSKLNLRYRVDPWVLGGVLFKFRDQQVDGTVRRGLQDLEKRFKSAELAAVSE